MKSLSVNKMISAPRLVRNRLYSFRNVYHVEEKDNISCERVLTSGFFNQCVIRAGYKISGGKLMLTSMLGATLGLLIGGFSNLYFGLILGICFFYLPIWKARKEARERARRFSTEYPSILLSMSSNMKAGLTVYSSLERSVMLLPAESEVKTEVSLFLDRISRGMAREQAVAQFAETIELPELDLFRRAFSLVITHGGKFSATLERLAAVCRERENLVSASKVSTASMRMTSNVILFVAPLLLFILSSKNKDYWTIMLNNSTAFLLSVTGTIIIFSSVIVLRRMSDFKP